MHGLVGCISEVGVLLQHIPYRTLAIGSYRQLYQSSRVDLLQHKSRYSVRFTMGYLQYKLPAAHHTTIATRHVRSSTLASSSGRSHQALAPEYTSTLPSEPSCSSAVSTRSSRARSAFSGINRRVVQSLRQELQVPLSGRLSVIASVATAVPAAAPSAPPVDMKIVNVDLGDRSYPIYIGTDLLEQGELLRKHVPGKRVLVVTNETIAPLYLEK